MHQRRVGYRTRPVAGQILGRSARHMTLPPKQPPALPGQHHHANTLLTIALHTSGAELTSRFDLAT